MDELIQLNSSLADAIEAYALKPTKANSKRLRAVTQRLSNILPGVRSELIAEDKAK